MDWFDFMVTVQPGIWPKPVNLLLLRHAEQNTLLAPSFFSSLSTRSF